MNCPTKLNQSYVDHVANLEARLASDVALRHAVGGEFIAVGQLEYALLRSRGLKDGHLVVDVGCGSGRLASQIAPFAGIRYIGCDVVPRLLKYAADLCARPDWSFVLTKGTSIPAEDGQADFVTFFSVFTHLPQEQIFRYIRDAHRVLKPGGLLIMSFLEFQVPSHWATFIASVDQTRDDDHLNQFIERDALHAWASAAGFEIRSVHRGDTEYIPIRGQIRFENGSQTGPLGSLGQSVAILQKRVSVLKESTCRDPSSEAPLTASNSIPIAAKPRQAAGKFNNVSGRAVISAGASAIIGFTLAGASSNRVLIRAVGPGLRAFGVVDPVDHPTFTLNRGDKRVANAASGWSGTTELLQAIHDANAFTLAPDSGDAVRLLVLDPGNYTVVVQSEISTESGDVLVEVYLVG